MLSYRCWESIQTAGNYTEKKTKRYREQDPVKVEAYLSQIAHIPRSSIAYIDETGIDTYLFREYAYAPRGTLVYGKISGKKYRRVGIVAAQLGKKILAPLQYEGTMDSSLFEQWFQECLLPSLTQQAFIVMDNASFHRKSQLFRLAKDAGHTLIFLPPYSPDLNPIEHFWSWLKRHLAKTLRDFPIFDDALCSAFQVL